MKNHSPSRVIPIWPRAIILVDMNAFFCSVEQLDHPEWQGRPIGVTNGAQGTCIITSSYEARAYGVRTGMRLKEAQQICPGFIQVPAHPERYARVSSDIMDALSHITPDMEIFSVDEAFLDVTHCQRLLGPPQQIARLVQQTVLEASGGVLCSVGLSGDKTTAKYAAKLHKPNGLTIIPPRRARDDPGPGTGHRAVRHRQRHRPLSGGARRIHLRRHAQTAHRRTGPALRQPRPTHLADGPGTRSRSRAHRGRRSQSPSVTAR